MTLILVRHPEIATPNVIVGQTDAELSERGVAQIDALVRSLPRSRRIITSDLRRCRLLAQALGLHFDVACEIDVRWREQSFGGWEGRTWDAVGGRDYLDAWTTATPPGGESIRDVFRRVESALGDIDQDTTVVSHAGPIRCALSIALGMRLEEAFGVDIPFGSWRSL